MIFANPFARIVVAYDDSDAARAGLDHALVLAEQFGGKIVAVNLSDLSAAAIVPIRSAAPPQPADPAPLLASLDPARRALFHEISDRVASRDVPVTLEFSANGAVAGIVDAATRWDATAIAIGTHARTGLAHAWSGSVAEGVVRTADVPVVVVRANTPAKPLRRVVVGVDGSQPSATASVFATALALEHPIRLVYCSVIDTGSVTQPIVDLPFDPTPLLAEMRASARDALDAALQYANAIEVYPDTEIAEALDAATGIIQVADRQAAEAIVVGTHKNGAVERFFLGSTAEAVLRRAHAPVIVVPANAPIVPSLASGATAHA